MDKVPVQVDGRFSLGNILGSGSYTVVYHAQNIIKDVVVAVKLEPITHSSSVQREYHILKHLEGGVGIPRVIWFSRESMYYALLSRLKYIHSHNYVHGDIKPQNVIVGLGDLKDTAFIIDFGIAKEFWNTAASLHIPFCQGQCLTGTLAFASINTHLGVEPGRHDDLESLTYMLIYFLQGSLPCSSILKYKVDTTIENLCCGIPIEFTMILIYTRSLAFSEGPDYNHPHSLLHILCSAPTACILDLNQPDVPVITPSSSKS
ncbi:kinase-like domain-containing protein [Suillus fuscotomentosus]|uniref:non-specific serine/threonine protein kinase n=1 Tax=Suillus fuscotomentosus TaxID=1912939 RepID=A0AAD4HF66_9AGAM|nr:kinase-like domain-containing protein [Suillus fuscotomentosus]KAG1895395.1 kinase-like domain-containing protein [Suillus fuscotomentosus]